MGSDVAQIPQLETGQFADQVGGGILQHLFAQRSPRVPSHLPAEQGAGQHGGGAFAFGSSHPDAATTVALQGEGFRTCEWRM